MKRVSLIIFCISLFLLEIPSQIFPKNLHPQVIKSTKHLYNMNYKKSLHLLRNYQKEHPNDLPGLNYLAITLLQQEMNRQGILERFLFGRTKQSIKKQIFKVDESLRNEFLGIINSAKNISINRITKNPRDFEAKYWLGVNRATLGTFRISLQKSFLSALKAFNASRKIHEELINQDSTFIDSQLTPGAHEYIMGSLPWYVKSFGALAGFSGNKKRGLLMVEEVRQKGVLAQEEAKFMMVSFYGREKRFKERLQLLQELSNSHPQNYLIFIGLAKTSEILGDTKGALKAYESILKLQKKEDSVGRRLPISRTFYRAGLLKVKLGCAKEALSYFKSASNYKIKSNPYALLSQLAIARIYENDNRVTDAINIYSTVRTASPKSNEGKRAKKALKRIKRSQRKKRSSL